MSKFSTAKQFINQIFGGKQKTYGTGAIDKVSPNVPVTKGDKKWRTQDITHKRLILVKL